METGLGRGATKLMDVVFIPFNTPFTRVWTIMLFTIYVHNSKFRFASIAYLFLLMNGYLEHNDFTFNRDQYLSWPITPGGEVTT